MKSPEIQSTLVVVIALGALAAGGCARKGYVEEGFMAQDSRLADIESGVEANERGLKSTGTRIDRMSSDVKKAGSKSAAAAARADEAYDLAQGQLHYTVVLSEVAGHFGFDGASLTDAARARLDDVAKKMKHEAKIYLEIEGHTDSTGTENYNLGLGMRRAESARHYLNKKHGLPLHRMSVTSYGETQPVTDNASKEGRAKNRRVEVRVLS